MKEIEFWIIQENLEKLIETRYKSNKKGKYVSHNKFLF